MAEAYIFRLRNPEDPSKPFIVAEYFPRFPNEIDGVALGEAMGDLRTAAYLWNKPFGRDELAKKLRSDYQSLQELQKNIAKRVQQSAKDIEQMVQTYNKYEELISKIEKPASGK